MPIAPRPLSKSLRATTPPPRPWPNLPVETQAQAARLLADLLRRLVPSRHPATESSRAERRPCS
jgi:hypothetical protein